MRPREIITVSVLCGLLLAFGTALQQVCPRCGGSKVVTCSYCQGDWRRFPQTVPCLRQQGAGCDETGYRKCFRCRGKGERTCSVCRGSGRRTVRYSTGGLFKHTSSRTCSKCRGTGRVDCPHCKPGRFCSECKRCFTPHRSRWSPRPVSYCRFCYPGSDSGNGIGGVPAGGVALKEVPGIIRCPRCKGQGYREIKAKCPHCHRGQIACPLCISQSKP